MQRYRNAQKPGQQANFHKLQLNARETCEMNLTLNLQVAVKNERYSHALIKAKKKGRQKEISGMYTKTALEISGSTCCLIWKQTKNDIKI